MLGIALCHDVSPVERQTGGDAPAARFQGASPDELALVQFAAQCGITLHARSRTSIVLRLPGGWPSTQPTPRPAAHSTPATIAPPPPMTVSAAVAPTPTPACGKARALVADSAPALAAAATPAALTPAALTPAAVTPARSAASRTLFSARELFSDDVDVLLNSPPQRSADLDRLLRSPPSPPPPAPPPSPPAEGNEVAHGGRSPYATAERGDGMSAVDALDAMRGAASFLEGAGEGEGGGEGGGEGRRRAMRWPSASNLECTRLVEYEILDELAFSSELKRMGILVRAKDTGQVSRWHGLHLCAPEAATRGCNPRCRGCNPGCERLQA